MAKNLTPKDEEFDGEDEVDVEVDGEFADDEDEIEIPALEELSDEELEALEAFLTEDFEVRTEGVEEFSVEDSADIAELGQAIVTVRTELAARATTAAERQAAIEAVKASTRTAAPAPAAEEVVEEAAETELAAEDDKRSKKYDFSPVGIKGNVEKDAAGAPEVSIRASADVPGFKAGQILPDLGAAARAFAAKRPQITGTDKGNDGYRYLVASIDLPERSEDRVLSESDLLGNEAKIEAVTDALVASGGLCAPATPLYDLTVLGADACRPVQDSLQGFRAERGAVRFLQPPKFNAASGSTRVTTATEDAAGYNADGTGGKTIFKPCLAITCGAEVNASLDAVSRCLTFGNFGSRTYPEQVEAWIKLSLAAQAQRVEQYFIDKIKAGSTAVTAAAYGGYGATRSILHQVGVAVAAWRSRYRYCGNATLRAVFPAWVKELIRTDLANDSFDGHAWSVSDAQIAQWFADRNVSATFYVDTPTTGTSQVFGTQGAGALLDFPTVVQWGLFPDGAWIALEGGSIDLGIVRDSTLNSTNDYQIWAEEFIGIVNRGHESLWITSTVCPTGTGPASVTPPVCP